MLAGDFNAEESKPWISQFIDEYNAKNIVQEDTCFKSVLNPSCIDLLITNSLLSFQNTIAVSNGLSGFRNMVITVMKMSFKKHSPIERYYRDYKYFDLTKFKDNLNEKLIEGMNVTMNHLKLLSLKCWTNMVHLEWNFLELIIHYKNVEESDFV